MAASPTPGGSASRSRAKQLERQLTLLEERTARAGAEGGARATIENLRSQLRSLSAMRSAEKRQIEVLRQEIGTLRDCLHGKPLPAPTAELKQVEARAVAEARAERRRSSWTT